MSLSHIEVLSEVLVSAPPIGMDHTDSLVSSHLMDVGISDIVLLSISWEPSVAVWTIIELIVLTNMPSPLIHHTLLLLLCDEVEDE